MTGLYPATPTQPEENSVTYTPEEIREHREQWLAELRSGNRRQVQGYLACQTENGDTGYCCLCVATELAGVTSAASPGRGYRLYATDGGGDEYLTLPSGGRAWLGVSVSDPRLALDTDSEDDWDYLRSVLGIGEVLSDIREGVLEEGADLTGALLNDKGATFEQIADLFEHFGFHVRDDLLTVAA
jgi:hypothetical protein